MKSLPIILFLAALTSCGQSKEKYSESVLHAVEQLRIHCGIEGRPEVGGSAVGYEGEPHPTYLLGLYISRMGELSDFKAMLSDEDPVVRVIGACSIISNNRILFLEEEIMEELVNENVDYEEYWKQEIEIRKEYLENYTIDKTEIIVGPGGCNFETSSVGAVIKALIENPQFFVFGAEPVAGGDAAR